MPTRARSPSTLIHSCSAVYFSSDGYATGGPPEGGRIIPPVPIIPAVTERSYYIWTVGCQMNEADSEKLARELERRGLRPAGRLDQADYIVLNTCSVRAAAEEK